MFQNEYVKFCSKVFTTKYLATRLIISVRHSTKVKVKFNTNTYNFNNTFNQVKIY